MTQALQLTNPAPRSVHDEEMHFLRRVAAAPGILSGTDLRNGAPYRCIVPADAESIIKAHVLGPAHVAEPPEMDAMMSNGECHHVRTYIRATVLPSGADGLTTHIAVKFKTEDSLAPSEAIVAASLALRRACIDHYVERSVLAGVWVIWIVFDTPVDCVHAESLSRRVREILRGIGIGEGDYTIPLLQDDPTPLHLPCMFFSGGFFGRLFNVDDEGHLREIGSASASARNTSTAGPSSTPHVADGWLDDLLVRWFERHGDRAVRAGDLTIFAKEVGLLPPRLADLTPQAAAIGLGRELLAAANAGTTRLPVTASRSGHSNVFRVG